VNAEAPRPRLLPLYFYSSSSGMVNLFCQRVVEGTDRQAFALADRQVRQSVPDGSWVLVTPSYKTGNPDNDTIPEAVKRFLRNPATRRRLVGIMGSGNRNFGAHYQAAARQIAAASHRPILFEFELTGTPWDIEEARAILADLDQALAAPRLPDSDGL
jgi:protein involved in ribonucleotide reduction